MPYVAPYRLPDGQPYLPEGEFLVPLCTTRERLTKMLTVLTYGGLLYGQPGISDYDHIIDLMRALGWVDDPCKADCFPCEEKCVEYPPYAQFIDWSPQNPFTQPDLIPPPYTAPPFYVVPETPPFVGTQKGDVIVSLNSATLNPFPNILPPPFGTILELLNSGFPRFRVNLPDLTRTTQVELHMVSFPSAGIAYITQDANPIGAQWVDLNVDVTDLVPFTLQGSLATIQIVEMEIAPGDHFIDVTFLPYPDDDFPWAYFGGGLRKVVICGQDARSMAYFKLRQNPDDPCLLEQQLQPNGAWSTAFDYELCKGDARNTYINQRTQNTIINNQRIDRYDGTPGSVNGSAPTTNFNGDGSSAREDALCMAVRAYVEKQAHDAAIQAGFVLAGTVLLTVAVSATILGGIVGGVAVITSGIALAKYVEAANDREAQKRVICDLTDRLKGQTVTEATFVSVLTGLPSSGDPDFAIYNTLRDGAGRRENYLFFLDLLGEAYDVAQAGGNDCPCDDEWCYEFDFTVSDGGFSLAANSVGRPYGEYVAGLGWRQTSYPDSPNERAAGIVRLISVQTTITSVSIYTAVEPWSMGVSHLPNIITLGYPSALSHDFRIITGALPEVNLTNLDWQNAQSLLLDVYNPSHADRWTTITRVVVRGTGINPFGTDNCT